MAEPGTATIHGLVTEQAAARPDAIAVQYADRHLTYGELHRAASRLAARLVADGLRPGELVLVSTPRTPALPVTLLAVLIAGCGYIAADHRWPPTRLADVARQADRVLVVGPAAGADLPGALRLPGDVDELAGDGPLLAEPPAVSGADPFCVIFTSGSTGVPKGVLTLHGGTALRLHDVDYAPLDQDTVTLQASPLPWDGLTLELWGPLVNGGRVLLHDGSPITPTALRRARERGVNTMFLTASLFGGIVQDDVAALGGFRQLITGAERTSVRAVREFLNAHPEGRLLHIYGPAEATMYATTLQLTLDELAGLDDVPLGPPLPATTVTIRDAALRALPDGEVGEICIGGAGLAAGYVGDDALTTARFVHLDGERQYRTGDLGWIDERHRLRFVGRQDRQVKLRGNRLELSEVEAAMRREPAVVEAHAVVHTSAAGTARLVGHYTTVDAIERSAAVRALCAGHLPAYAVPAELRHHVRLPVNVNGKVDLAALAELPPESAPLSRDPLLARLQRLVSDVSGYVPAPETDLIESGVDSLAAMRIAYRVSRDFAVAFELDDLYSGRSLTVIAERLPALPPLPSGSADGGLKATLFDWWLREQLLPGDPAALILGAYRILGGSVSAAVLTEAVRDLADRHDLLRARIEQTSDEPRVTVLARGTVCPLLVDDEPVDLDAGLPARWLAPFDLEAAPAWRVCLGADPSGTPVVGLVLHHWLVDGWSEGLLVTDLGTAWRARANGLAPDWPEPAATIDELGTDRAPEPGAREFWTDLLAGVEQLPLPRPTGPVTTAPGAWYLRCAPEPGATGRPAGEDVQARLMAAWGAALAAMSCDGTYLVGVGYAARDRVSETAIGCHVELIPLPLAATTDVSGNAAEIATAWRAALRHRSLPLPEMLAGVPRDRRRRAMQAVFVVQANARPELDLGPERTVRRVDLPTVAPLYPLAMECWPARDGGVLVRLEWDRRLVDETWAETVRKHMVDALPGVGFREAPDG